ncbi:telomere repeats-binding bouquet formation protein 2 [Cynoglossus semilaevis]|uniref:telomere repeats-binding bouquet formation protein 2 n=1 Tax=Cynoglossus semilaevis TaxID=244447 RepID=UPI000495151F|nr:telomere repeats-binding bouquet formation protein 2 [Cynoglossus semilaevis]
MFREKSAWFSKSVSPNSRTFWIVQGGTVTGWKTADYIFSEDATCQDTLRIFLSKDYLLNKVTVFHSEFLSACERRQSVRSVSIGHYVLPPVSVQDEIRQVVGRLIWEFEHELPTSELSSQDGHPEGGVHRGREESDTDSSDVDQCPLLKYPDRNQRSGYIAMDALPKYLGDLCDFYPKCSHCSNCGACTSTITNMKDS